MSHPLLNRRRFLTENASALSGIALAQLLQSESLLGATPQLRESAPGKTPIRPDIDPANPSAPRTPPLRRRSAQCVDDLQFGRL